MNFQTGPYIFPLLFTGIVASILAIYAWRQRPALGATAFAISLLGEAIWSFSNAMQWASTEFSRQVFWANFRFFGTEIITFFFLIFAIQYTRQNRRVPRWIYLLLILSLVSVGLLWTNDYHHLFFTAIEQINLGEFTALAFSYGPGFWVHTAFNYLLLSATFLIYTMSFFASRAIYRLQMVAVLLGLTIPWIFNIISVFEISPIAHLDLTPFGLLIGMIALTAGFFRYKILDLVSFSRDTMLQYMTDALLVVDLGQRISDLNPAAERLLTSPDAGVIGQPVNEVFASWPELANSLANLDSELNKEIKFEDEAGFHFYLLNTTPLLDDDKETIGYLIQLNDISDRKQTEAERRKGLSFLEALEESYFETDIDGNLRYVNDVFVDSVGKTREDILKKYFCNFLPAEHQARLETVFRRVMKTGVTETGIQYPFLKQGVEFRHGEASISRLLDEGEKPLGVRALIRDITDRVEAAQRISLARDEAEARAKDLASINRMADRVSSSLQLKDILKTICVELVEIFQSRNAGIGLLDSEKRNLVIEAFFSVEQSETDATGVRIALEGNEASLEALNSHKAVVILDAQTDPRTKSTQQLMKERGTRSLLIVPLMTRGEAIGTIGLPSLDPDRPYTQAEVELAETIASQVASAIDNSRLYELTDRARDVAERDLEIGRTIQSSFFPNTLPENPDWEIRTYFKAARQVAGDFYDAFNVGTRGRIAIVLADVTDKGVGAALFMALFRSLIRSTSGTEDFDGDIHAALISVIKTVNNYIADTHGDSNMFATLIFGVLDPAVNTLHYINAGHERPLIISAAGKLVARLEPTGPAVGLFVDLPFTAVTVSLAPGDLFFAYTDGVSDARGLKGEFFGEEKIDSIAIKQHASAFSLLRELKFSIDKHNEGADQFDDITMLAVRRKLDKSDYVHALELPADLESMPVMRDFVELASAELDLDAESAFAFKVAAAEHITNIIQHSYLDTSPGKIKLTVARSDSYTSLEIWDDGRPFDPKSNQAPDLSLGLEEIDYMSDKDIGNTLSMKRRIAS